MATVKVKGIAGVRKSVEKLFDEIRKDPQTLVEISEITIDQIVGFTQSGKSVSTNSNFPHLAESTIENRKRVAKLNQPDPLYSPNKSNLTLTGQLMKSIKATIFPSKGTVEVSPKGSHPGYKTSTGRTKSEDNADIFGWLEKKGFRVFGFSQQFKDRLTSRVNVLIKRTIRKKISKL